MSFCGAERSAAVTHYVIMAMPGLLYSICRPDRRMSSARSRAIVKGSFGTGRCFQKSPFQPVSLSCGLSSSSASSMPDVWEPSCRSVIRDLRDRCATWE